MTTGGSYVNPDTITSFNILLRLNQTFKLTLTCTDSTNTPINFTGCTISMDIRAQQNMTGAVLATWGTTSSEISLGTPTLGILSITVAASVVADYTWEKGYFDIKMISTDGTQTIIAQGEIDTYQGVTT